MEELYVVEVSMRVYYGLLTFVRLRYLPLSSVIPPTVINYSWDDVEVSINLDKNIASLKVAEFTVSVRINRVHYVFDSECHPEKYPNISGDVKVSLGDEEKEVSLGAADDVHIYVEGAESIRLSSILRRLDEYIEMALNVKFTSLF